MARAERASNAFEKKFRCETPRHQPASRDRHQVSNSVRTLSTFFSISIVLSQYGESALRPCASGSQLTVAQTTALKSIKSLAPLLDRVLVQRIKAEAKTKGGILLTESAVKELNEAKVLAVGPGAMDKEGKRIPMGVTAGDKVLIPQVSDKDSASISD